MASCGEFNGVYEPISEVALLVARDSWTEADCQSTTSILLVSDLAAHTKNDMRATEFPRLLGARSMAAQERMSGSRGCRV